MKALAFVTTLFLPPTFVAVRIHNLKPSKDVADTSDLRKDIIQYVNV